MRRRHVATLMAGVATEAALFRTYRANDARFHWYVHFLTAGQVTLHALAWRRRRGLRVPDVVGSVVAVHLVAVVPDVLFMGGRAHRRWMDVFVGHISSHRMPGRNTTWYVLFLLALADYLRSAPRLAADPVPHTGLQEPPLL